MDNYLQMKTWCVDVSIHDQNIEMQISTSTKKLVVSHFYQNGFTS